MVRSRLVFPRQIGRTGIKIDIALDVVKKLRKPTKAQGILTVDQPQLVHRRAPRFARHNVAERVRGNKMPVMTVGQEVVSYFPNCCPTGLVRIG